MQSVPPSATIPRGDGPPITCTADVDELLALASAGDVRTIALRIQARAEVDGSVTPTLEHWVVPALRETGLRWQRREYSVADDHVITNTLSEALGVARAARPPLEVHGTAAAVTLGSDQHEICARLTQVCLDGAGFSCVLLGRGLPIGDLVRWVNETSPDVLACSVPITLDPARANAELIALCASLGPRTTIYVGGAGAALLGFVPPGVCYLRSLHELEAAMIARRRHRGRSAPRRAPSVWRKCSYWVVSGQPLAREIRATSGGPRMCLLPREPMRIDQHLPVSPEERGPLLDARREAKMTSSVHAYVRGSTKRFYEWSKAAPPGTFPSGPSIWIGGDCHVGNFGAIAAMGGELGIDLRDLDQTVIGSPVHDVMRLCLSMAMAVRASDLPGECTARVLESISRGYESVLEARAAHLDFIVRAPPAQVSGVLREATSRSRREALAERLGKHDGTIPIGRRFWPLTQPERTAVEKLILTARVRKLVTSLTSRDDDAGIELVDAAYWVKGCSSLGYFRAAALVRVGGAKGTSKSLALLDVKEAIPALAPRAPRSRMPANHGERVVTGARALAPSLGERMAPASLRDKHVFVRELLPQDLKLELTRLRREEAMAIGGYLGSVLGVAHARQLTPTACAAWLASFRRGKSDNLTVPAWLWSAVVELVALHERAYLDHCRKHLAAGPRPAPEDLPLTG